MGNAIQDTEGFDRSMASLVKLVEVERDKAGQLRDKIHWIPGVPFDKTCGLYFVVMLQ